MVKSPVAHDHIVLLLNTPEFEALPSWLTENFNIIEGGTHAGGSSRNKLIIFRDGTYLELFNWIKEPAEFLAWSHKPPGLIDFALTTMTPVSAEQNFKDVSTRLGQISSTANLGVTFEEPQSGGRKRKDGTEVRWETTRPVFEKTTATPGEENFPTGRLDAPFFCHDVTERLVRVPFDDEHITTHPCGAIGIDSVQVLVPHSCIEQYAALYTGILGCRPSSGPKSPKGHSSRIFEISVPNAIDQQPTFVSVTSQQDSMSLDTSSISEVNTELGERAKTHLKERGIGIYSIKLRTAEESSEATDVALGTDAIGSVVMIKRRQ